jgi:hypothetical protein
VKTRMAPFDFFARVKRHLFPLGLVLIDSSLLVTQEFALKTRSETRNFVFADAGSKILAK